MAGLGSLHQEVAAQRGRLRADIAAEVVAQRWPRFG